MRKTLLLVTLLIGPLGVGTVAPVIAAEAAATKTVTLAVENMTCGACPITVRKALTKVPGVTKAEADLDSKTATVAFDPAKATVDDLIRATTEAGYPSKPVR